MAKTQTSQPSKNKENFVASVRTAFSGSVSEVSARNEEIEQRDNYVYSDKLERVVDTPIGHDKTPVNWLRRTVEIHKNMFMSRGFQVISTYDTQDSAMAANEEDMERIKLENKKDKAYAESRKNMIDSIIRDNGGFSTWSDLAESASAVGTACVKTYYDKDAGKMVISPIESIENVYVLWGRDNFRDIQAVAFAYQVSKEKAISEYGAPQNVATSPLGRPLEAFSRNTGSMHSQSTQPMVTILEVTGKIDGWCSDKGQIKECTPGQEKEMNVKIIGEDVMKVIDDPKKLPKYYLLPNKRQRRRPWGVSDISEAAININVTYVETLSDWRTVSAKVNFPKYKAFGFGNESSMPRSEPRKMQAIPLSEGQDLVQLDQGRSDNLDFRAQMDELKEQFVRETGISRVLFDDPSVTLNSNQALLTSMKPTSDIAEAKKQLWGPIIERMFRDSLETIGENNPDLKGVVDGDYDLKVMWPSVMQKEDPVYQQMLLNRFNSNTISLQSFLEQQGESKEEVDRIRDELEDPVTASILGRILGELAQQKIQPPAQDPKPEVKVSLSGALTPQQEANLASQQGFNDGPFPPSMGPQGSQGKIAQENQDNQEFLTGSPFDGGMPITRGPDGQPVGMDKGGQNGQDQRPQVATPGENQPGQGVVSQPGSGATPTSAQGALNQNNQQAGN